MSGSGIEAGAVDRVWAGKRLRQGFDVLAGERAGWGELARSPTLRAVFGSRLVVWVAGLVALAIFGRNQRAVIVFDPNGASAPFHSAVANFLLAPVARWDSIWYLQIAHAGYFSQQSSGMFPLYPMLIRIGTTIFRSELLVGLAVSLVSMALALYLLERLVRLDFDEATARKTVLLIAFFPAAFFLSAVYTESLYLLVSVGAVYAARRDRWSLAGICGGLAAATRSDGILILAPLLLIYLYGPRAHPRLDGPCAWWKPRYRVRTSVGWLALVPAGLAAYLAYLGIAHGQPFATYYAQEAYWGHHFAGPFGGVIQAISQMPHDLRVVLTGATHSIGPGEPMSWNARNLIDLGFLAVPVVGLIGAWRRVPFAYLAYTILLLAFDLSFPDHKEPLESIYRYTLVIFPVFIGWALILKRRARATLLVLGTSTVLLAVFSGLWATWLWVG
jgi:Mannosyltransferase (PIG-V)